MWIRMLLRAEATALFGVGTTLWILNGASPLLFVPALLLPDLSMIGYVFGRRVGAIVYNTFHTVVLAAGLLGLGALFGLPAARLTGALLLAHIGMDRALGFGLKLPTGFRDTHLGRIGRGP